MKKHPNCLTGKESAEIIFTKLVSGFRFQNSKFKIQT